MPYSLFDDPARWRERAEEARSIAAQLNEPESSRMLLRIAEDYERLAKHAERRAQKRAEGVEEDAPLAICMAHLGAAEELYVFRACSRRRKAAHARSLATLC